MPPLKDAHEEVLICTTKASPAPAVSSGSSSPTASADGDGRSGSRTRTRMRQRCNDGESGNTMATDSNRNSSGHKNGRHDGRIGSSNGNANGNGSDNEEGAPQSPTFRISNPRSSNEKQGAVRDASTQHLFASPAPSEASDGDGIAASTVKSMSVPALSPLADNPFLKNDRKRTGKRLFASPTPSAAHAKPRSTPPSSTAGPKAKPQPPYLNARRNSSPTRRTADEEQTASRSTTGPPSPAPASDKPTAVPSTDPAPTATVTATQTQQPASVNQSQSPVSPSAVSVKVSAAASPVSTATSPSVSPVPPKSGLSTGNTKRRPHIPDDVSASSSSSSDADEDKGDLPSSGDEMPSLIGNDDPSFVSNSERDSVVPDYGDDSDFSTSDESGNVPPYYSSVYPYPYPTGTSLPANAMAYHQPQPSPQSQHQRRQQSDDQETTPPSTPTGKPAAATQPTRMSPSQQRYVVQPIVKTKGILKTSKSQPETSPASIMPVRQLTDPSVGSTVPGVTDTAQTVEPKGTQAHDDTPSSIADTIPTPIPTMKPVTSVSIPPNDMEPSSASASQPASASRHTTSSTDVPIASDSGASDLHNITLADTAPKSTLNPALGGDTAATETTVGAGSANADTVSATELASEPVKPPDTAQATSVLCALGDSADATTDPIGNDSHPKQAPVPDQAALYLSGSRQEHLQPELAIPLVPENNDNAQDEASTCDNRHTEGDNVRTGAVTATLSTSIDEIPLNSASASNSAHGSKVSQDKSDIIGSDEVPAPSLPSKENMPSLEPEEALQAVRVSENAAAVAGISDEATSNDESVATVSTDSSSIVECVRNAPSEQNRVGESSSHPNGAGSRESDASNHEDRDDTMHDSFASMPSEDDSVISVSSSADVSVETDDERSGLDANATPATSEEIAKAKATAGNMTPPPITPTVAAPIVPSHRSPQPQNPSSTFVDPDNSDHSESAPPDDSSGDDVSVATMDDDDYDAIAQERTGSAVVEKAASPVATPEVTERNSEIGTMLPATMQPYRIKQSALTTQLKQPQPLSPDSNYDSDASYTSDDERDQKPPLVAQKPSSVPSSALAASPSPPISKEVTTRSSSARRIEKDENLLQRVPDPAQQRVVPTLSHSRPKTAPKPILKNTVDMLPRPSSPQRRSPPRPRRHQRPKQRYQDHRYGSDSDASVSSDEGGIVTQPRRGAAAFERRVLRHTTSASTPSTPSHSRMPLPAAPPTTLPSKIARSRSASTSTTTGMGLKLPQRLRSPIATQRRKVAGDRFSSFNISKHDSESDSDGSVSSSSGNDSKSRNMRQGQQHRHQNTRNRHHSLKSSSTTIDLRHQNRSVSHVDQHSHDRNKVNQSQRAAVVSSVSLPGQKRVHQQPIRPALKSAMKSSSISSLGATSRDVESARVLGRTPSADGRRQPLSNQQQLGALQSRRRKPLDEQPSSESGSDAGSCNGSESDDVSVTTNSDVDETPKLMPASRTVSKPSHDGVQTQQQQQQAIAPIRSVDSDSDNESAATGDGSGIESIPTDVDTDDGMDRNNVSENSIVATAEAAPAQLTGNAIIGSSPSDEPRMELETPAGKHTVDMPPRHSRNNATTDGMNMVRTAQQTKTGTVNAAMPTRSKDFTRRPPPRTVSSDVRSRGDFVRAPPARTMSADVRGPPGDFVRRPPARTKSGSTGLAPSLGRTPSGVLAGMARGGGDVVRRPPPRTISGSLGSPAASSDSSGREVVRRPPPRTKSGSTQSSSDAFVRRPPARTKSGATTDPVDSPSSDGSTASFMRRPPARTKSGSGESGLPALSSESSLAGMSTESSLRRNPPMRSVSTDGIIRRAPPRTVSAANSSMSTFLPVCIPEDEEMDQSGQANQLEQTEHKDPRELALERNALSRRHSTEMLAAMANVSRTMRRSTETTESKEVGVSDESGAGSMPNTNDSNSSGSGPPRRAPPARTKSSDRFAAGGARRPPPRTKSKDLAQMSLTGMRTAPMRSQSSAGALMVGYDQDARNAALERNAMRRKQSGDMLAAMATAARGVSRVASMSVSQTRGSSSEHVTRRAPARSKSSGMSGMMSRDLSPIREKRGGLAGLATPLGGSGLSAEKEAALQRNAARRQKSGDMLAAMSRAASSVPDHMAPGRTKSGEGLMRRAPSRTKSTDIRAAIAAMTPTIKEESGDELSVESLSRASSQRSESSDLHAMAAGIRQARVS